MRKIAVFTGTRAEYGLLYWVLRGLKTSKDVELQLFVGGAHLSRDFGYTVDQIENDGFEIKARLDFLASDDSETGIAESMSKALSEGTKAISFHRPDILVLLGDRYEVFAVAQAAMLCRTPIAHIHGGELTEGAIDDAMRHSITKLSHIHFAATSQYRNRILQMGENPAKVFEVGAPGLDNINKITLLSREMLSKKLDFDLSHNFFLVTFHPETLGHNTSKNSLKNLLQALNNFQHYKLVITYPNADEKGLELIEICKQYQRSQPERVFLVQSLGQLRYLSTLRYCSAVIGNSSSGLIEAPSLNVPTVNMGHRQTGRDCAASVITCDTSTSAITFAINQALSKEFSKICQYVVNPYGEGDASEKIVDKLISFPLNQILNKRFFDINFSKNEIVSNKKG